ncbi:Zn-ribbon domain-containing OB-fold protein [Sphingobium sp. Ant17]|uniref:Zn-ribbon domain-containing OB-fold protein n=1 Tax=Sphingobium sp. Ant17 TaxID=1461752 RepID=UPI0004511A8D|nr:OB-fold domain-containing protein [Sphingobium sp. Ant17]EXS68794.1 DNA-binding protein [Sphingobium sp. Ant17]
MAWQRSRPRLDRDNRAFWTGGAEGKLHITRCGDCGNYTHPPRELCRHCQSGNVAPHAVAGTGIIDTYTINHQAWAKDMEVPFVIARVKLDDAPGVYLTTNIVGSPVDAVDIDDRVQVVFEEQDGIWFPLFEKVA